MVQGPLTLLSLKLIGIIKIIFKSIEIVARFQCRLLKSV